MSYLQEHITEDSKAIMRKKKIIMRAELEQIQG
jgi:hypothetical protein